MRYGTASEAGEGATLVEQGEPMEHFIVFMGAYNDARP
jgi:hypothetical protein